MAAAPSRWHEQQMRSLIRLLALVVATLAAPVAAAQERDEEQCLQLHPDMRSPVEMATCTSDMAGSERALAVALAALRAKVPAEYRPALEEAQGTWIRFRDAQCYWEAGGSSGSTGHSSAVIGCKADMNRLRAKQLTEDLSERW